jgi:uncharacterized RDD family membrane protein YckC
MSSIVENKYATFWRRFYAGLIDGLIFIPVGLLYSYTFSHSSSAPLRILVYLLNSSVFLVYSIWMLSMYGQTIGKWAGKVIVLDVSERPLTFRQAFLREIFGVVLWPIGLAINISRIIQGVDISQAANLTTINRIIGYSAFLWFVIEVVSMLTNNKRRALHDFIAGTVVIRQFHKANSPNEKERKR